MDKQASESYDEFYGRGGGRYDLTTEELFLIYRLLQPLRIRRGGAVLELGCGIGAHAFIFGRLGFTVTALDISSVGIEQARLLHPGPQYAHEDAIRFLGDAPSASYDIVFARALSWFQYELGPGPNRAGVDVPACTDHIMRLLRPGGIFILQVQSDFSGTSNPSGVRNHTWYDIAGLLEPRGDLVLFTDWSGLPMTNARFARAHGHGVLAGLRRPTEGVVAISNPA